MHTLIASRTLSARGIFLFAVSALLLLCSNTAMAGYPQKLVTYAAPWNSTNSLDPNTGTYGCLTDSAGGAEACAPSYFSPGDIQGSPWTSLSLSTCASYFDPPTACYEGGFGPPPDGGGLGVVVGQGCFYGGHYYAPVNLSYPGYCLLQIQINKNTGCQNCGSATTPQPIDMGSGNEYKSVTDYRGGGAFPLVFGRAYNSNLSNQVGVNTENGWNSGENLGNGWTTDVGAHLTIASRGQLFICPEPPGYSYDYLCPVIGYVVGSSPVEITVWEADGSQPTFTSQQDSGPDGTPLSTEQTGQGQLFFVATLPAPATGGGYK